MCKIMCMSGIETDKKELAVKFVKAMAERMSALPNDDGLGYAAMDSQGNLIFFIFLMLILLYQTV